jgi:hypothetical protein
VTTLVNLAPNSERYTTIRQRTADSAQKLQEVEHKIAQLEAINQQRQANNRQLRARLGLLTVPNGFEHNQGQVAATVPTGGGQMVVPEWIRSVGNGQVELLAGREPGEPTYVVELFLCPDYTETSTDTTAPWFLALLTGLHTQPVTSNSSSSSSSLPL